MEKQLTIRLLFLSVVYGVLCFFVLGMIIRIVVTFIYLREFSLSRSEVVDTFVMSCIAGIAAGGGSWVMEKIKNIKKKNK